MFLFFAFLAVPVMAHAGEADDLQRQIDYLKQTTNDLERQDDQKAVTTDLTMMRAWLDNAWTLRSQEKYDEVRIVLDRCEAQANMVRQRLNAAKLAAQATAKEDEVKRARSQLARTKKALENAKIQKARLEGKV
jgi:multidrug resistance efflux pump